MSDDFVEDMRALKEARKEHKRLYAIECHGCIRAFPRRNPTKMFEGQTCRVCGWKRPEDRKPS